MHVQKNTLFTVNQLKNIKYKRVHIRFIPKIITQNLFFSNPIECLKDQVRLVLSLTSLIAASLRYVQNVYIALALLIGRVIEMIKRRLITGNISLSHFASIPCNTWKRF